MTIADRRALTVAISALALEAGAAIMKIYGGSPAIATKADKSPVTDADRAAEAIILAGLKRLTPDIPAVSEEAVSDHGLPQTVGTRFWLVDPLDGTREFISRNGEFTVNIALIEDRRPALGVLLAPAMENGLLYAGHGPGTATLAKGGGAARPIAARPVPHDGLTVLVSRSHSEKATVDAFLARYPVRERVSVGSALKFGVLAEGAADLYPRLGRTMEWDTAAGHAVLIAAGGRVETLEGTEFLYAKPGFENPHFVAHGRG
ncbi:MAG: 3'(2'),5'-bisphosphate nucleotidase CysQ [Alphaproteobacteria bacterium]